MILLGCFLLSPSQPETENVIPTKVNIKERKENGRQNLFHRTTSNNSLVLKVTSPTEFTALSGDVSIKGVFSSFNGNISRLDLRVDSGSWQKIKWTPQGGEGWKEHFLELKEWEKQYNSSYQKFGENESIAWFSHVHEKNTEYTGWFRAPVHENLTRWPWLGLDLVDYYDSGPEDEPEYFGVQLWDTTGDVHVINWQEITKWEVKKYFFPVKKVTNNSITHLGFRFGSNWGDNITVYLDWICFLRTWEYKLDTSKLSNGRHKLTVRAVNERGSKARDSIFIIVEKRQVGFTPSIGGILTILVGVSGVLLLELTSSTKRGKKARRTNT